MTTLRVTQSAADALVLPDPSLRVTQVSADALVSVISIRSVTGSGGATVSGAASMVKELSAIGSGGAAVSGAASTTTVARYGPASTSLTNGWVQSEGATLYGVLDEVSASDTDFDRTFSASTMEVGFGTITAPSIDGGHVIRYRIKAASGQKPIRVELRSSGTLIKRWIHSSPPTSYTTYEQSLTEGEAALITNYSALTLRVAAGGPTGEFRALYSTTADQTTYTFSNCDIGTASATRRVVVVAYGEGDGALRTISSMTIAGQSATSHSNGNLLYHQSIWSATVASGSTGDIEVTFSGAMKNAAVAVFALDNLNSSTATELDPVIVSSNTVINTSLSTATDTGIVIAAANSLASGTCSWTGIEESFDSEIDTNRVFSGGIGYVTATSALTVEATFSASSAWLTFHAAHWS